MSALTGGMIAVQHVTPGAGALLYAAMIGTSGGVMRTLESAVVPNLYGTRHLGAIRGGIMFATRRRLRLRTTRHRGRRRTVALLGHQGCGA